MNGLLYVWTFCCSRVVTHHVCHLRMPSNSSTQAPFYMALCRYLNSKSARQRLEEECKRVRWSDAGLTPYYARFVATFRQLYPTFGNAVVDKLERGGFLALQTVVQANQVTELRPHESSRVARLHSMNSHCSTLRSAQNLRTILKPTSKQTPLKAKFGMYDTWESSSSLELHHQLKPCPV